MILLILIISFVGCVNPEVDGGEQAKDENNQSNNVGGESGETVKRIKAMNPPTTISAKEMKIPTKTPMTTISARKMETATAPSIRTFMNG